MQLVRIAGPTEAMLRLHEVDGLDFERTSANRLDDDTWQVAGYATDEALAEVESRGLTTELVVPKAKLAEERAVLYAAISREEPEEPSPDDAPEGGES
jgi:superfamily I DNA/RNA helicase